MKKIRSRKIKKKIIPKKVLPKLDAVCTFPTVAIGASAGGLATFTELLKALPADTGMAFVLIQHLDPTHPSLLTEMLSKTTRMKVQQIEEGMRIEPNKVYVIPPDSDIGILKSHFSLFPRPKNSKPHLSIDFFFKSLASDCGSHAIGIVLSGTANDGTEGLRAIKAENGLTFAQDPKSAKFEGMPQSAVNAEVVDFCLSIPAMARELVRLAHHPFSAGPGQELVLNQKDLSELQKIFIILKTSVGIDFSEYKPPTIRRRLARRMALLRIENLKKYIDLLKTSPEEAKMLASDVLIHVTSFFRDPEVFKKLQTAIFPALIKRKQPGSPIRIWVTGCSSGEEVYSIAITLLELLGEKANLYPIQLFGSDISDRMIEKARAGIYSESVLENIEPAILNRYFLKGDGGYRIHKSVRDLCVFVKHDLARDPPFTKLDLVTCRNVLIYFEPVLQKRIISTFHYCLNQPGLLLLGRTESISAQQNLFTTLDKTNKFFSRVAVTSQLKFATMQNTGIERLPFQSQALNTKPAALDLAKQMDSLLLTQYAPAGVVINEQMEVIQYRGKTGYYLEPPPGHPQLNLLKMVREGLFAPLKVALDQAKKRAVTIRKENIVFKHNDTKRICNLVVVPIAKLPESKEPLFLVLFEEITLPVKHFKKGAVLKKNKLGIEKATDRAAKLEHELRATQEYLQTLNEEHQKANDTLHSVNEEYLSGNEELQSMNEELETAKEELQSTNEELSTVNDELQSRNHETGETNDDLINLLNSAHIPVVILDLNRKIRRFTPEASKIMNFLPSDVGRLMSDIKPNFDEQNLDQQIKSVIKTGLTQEFEVKDQEGKWQRVQVRPYKTTDQKIAGAVLSIVNIDFLKRAVIDAEWIRDYFTNIVEAIQVPLLVLDEQIQTVSANHAFYSTFNLEKKDVEGKSLYELDAGHWNIEKLKLSLGEMLKKKNSFQNMEITCEFFQTGPKILSLSARPIQAHSGATMILLSMEDVTDRKQREKERKKLLQQTEAAKADAEKANLTKDLFLATLSHELRTPLTSLLIQAQMLQKGTLNEEQTRKACASIERAALTQTQLIGDLLDVSRIVTGKLKMTLQPVDLLEVIRDAMDTVSAAAFSKGINLELKVDQPIGRILGDPVRLQQVIWNLLSNAIKFSEKGKNESKILITLKEVNGQAEIKVTDSGMGIRAEFLPFVFNRFSQAEETNTRTHGGLGLGLAIVKHLVEMQEGSVKVESAGDHCGSTFTVTLPLIKATTKVLSSGTARGTIIAPPEQILRPTAPPLQGMKILIVEDDYGVREALYEILLSAGALVRTAESAFRALEILQDFSPDGLILDISMPGEDGYSLLKKIRARGEVGQKKIPALALTALATDKDRENAFSAGFQMHLTKPVNIDQLTRAMIELRQLTLA